MKGSGTKLPGYRDNSTRPDKGNEEILAVSGAFTEASAPPAPRHRKGSKKPKKRRKAQENIRERFFSLRLTFQEHAALLKAAGDVPLGSISDPGSLTSLYPTITPGGHSTRPGIIKSSASFSASSARPGWRTTSTSLRRA